MRYRRTDRQPDTRYSDQISRSARRDGGTKNVRRELSENVRRTLSKNVSVRNKVKVKITLYTIL